MGNVMAESVYHTNEIDELLRSAHTKTTLTVLYSFYSCI
jgi:hypothetical protein